MSNTMQQSIVLSNPADLQDVVDEQGIDNLLEDPVASAHLSYYQRALRIDTQRVLDGFYKEMNRESRKDSSLNNFSPLARFTEEQRELIMENLAAIQLTVGCNAGIEAGCIKWCAADAVPGIREQMPFTVFQEMVNRYGKWMRLANTEVYLASDVSDYKDRVDGRGVDIRDVLAELKNADDGYRPYIASAFAKGSEGRMADVHVDRISRFEMNFWHFEQRGLYDMHPEAPVDVYEYRPAGVIAGEEHRNSPFGIGCFNGMFMTPRSLYSVAQSYGVDDAFPQKLVVVPYVGESKELPKKGEDIREVLMHHIPLLTWIRDPYGQSQIWKYFNDHPDVFLDTVPNSVLIQHPGDDNWNPLVTIFEGSQVQQVVNLKKYLVRETTPLLNEIKAAKGHWRNRHTLNSGVWTIAQSDLMQKTAYDSNNGIK